MIEFSCFFPLEYHLGITFNLFVIEFSSVAQYVTIQLNIISVSDWLRAEMQVDLILCLQTSKPVWTNRYNDHSCKKVLKGLHNMSTN